MERMNRFLHKGWERSLVWRKRGVYWLRALIIVLGVMAFVMLFLAFTRYPYEAHRWLGTAAGQCRDKEPQVIVLLGGSGMPSGDEMLRLYYSSEWAKNSRQAQVVVMHPLDTLVMQAMVDELTMRGVEKERVHREMTGTNTREQAITLYRDHPGWRGLRLAVVTAPENMYRTLQAFRKAGFNRVCGAPAWDTPMFVDLDYFHEGVGGKAYVPDVSGSDLLRYDLWNRLKLEITCAREFMAIAYYKANGWI